MHKHTLGCLYSGFVWSSVNNQSQHDGLLNGNILGLLFERDKLLSNLTALDNKRLQSLQVEKQRILKLLAVGRRVKSPWVGMLYEVLMEDRET